ncbi:RNase H-like domain-containing protein, partial [Desulfovibrio sp. JC022]|uniref:RNase H-like domain-containing protein n=1 Tax=Desulfovibrio sp. JC022 TaxID=2593642 RepID=UPI0013D4CBB3
GKEDFSVFTDACGDGLGAVLMQRGKVIVYISRKFKPHDGNYVSAGPPPEGG